MLAVSDGTAADPGNMRPPASPQVGPPQASGGASASGGAGGSAGAGATLIPLSASEAIPLLIAADEADNLIVDVTRSDGLISIRYEDGSTIAVRDDEDIEIHRSAANWSVEFGFPDEPPLELGMLGELGIRKSAIQLNPFGTAPLVAVASITTPVAGRLFARVRGQDGDSSDIVSALTPYGRDHELLVLGLYAGYDNEVEFTLTRRDGTPRVTQSIEITTEPLSDEYLEFTVEVPYPEPIPNGLAFMVNVTSLGVPFFVDPFGKIRYLLTVPLSTASKRGVRGVQRLRNGHLGFADLGPDQVREFTWAGEPRGAWGVGPDYVTIHHDLYEKPNGNFLTPVYEAGARTVEDIIVEIDRNTGDLVRVWDLKESLQADRRALVNDDIDWVHVNAVVYDESDDTIIVSGQRQGVFKLTNDNELVWVLSPRAGWNEDFLPYLLRLDSGTEPTWGQHAAELLPNGNVIVFDNGLGRDFTGNEHFSRIVEYEIDAQPGGGGRARQVFEYGADRPELFSPIISDADYYPEDGHRLMVAGSLSAVMRYNSPDDFSVRWNRSIEEKARIIELDPEGRVYFEMIASGPGRGSVYRAERMFLRP